MASRSEGIARLATRIDIRASGRNDGAARKRGCAVAGGREIGAAMIFPEPVAKLGVLGYLDAIVAEFNATNRAKQKSPCLKRVCMTGELTHSAHGRAHQRLTVAGGIGVTTVNRMPTNDSSGIVGDTGEYTAQISVNENP
jgi:hypothetical protein